jgi:benzoyl-CoA reductase subunit C
MSELSLEDVIRRAEALYFDFEYNAVRDWRDRNNGAKAIGYLPIYAPREIIDAAGMLPVGIMGGRGQLEIIRGDAYYQSYICQMPRSVIELALTGRLDMMDGFLFPSICDVIRNLSGMWKVLFPEKYAHYFDVPQNFNPEVGGQFYEAELNHIRRDMEKLSGRKITDDDLRASIVRYNENRKAIGELTELRRVAPWQARCHESYLVLYAGTMLPVEDHTELVRNYISAVKASDRQMRDNVRVVSVGSFCEQPPLELIKTLEMAGCYIVWDDMSLGRQWLQGNVPEEGDPIRALSDTFLTKSVSTAARYEPDDKGKYLLNVLQNTKSEGVVLAAPSFCDPALLEQPMLQDALDKADVPWTAFKYAENLGQFQVIREQAGTFADSIKLWSDA